MTATVALMKSRDPNLTPQRIQDILRNQARGSAVVPHPDMQSAGVSPVFMLDVEKAVKAVMGPTPRQAQDYFALVRHDPIATTGKLVYLNKFVEAKSNTFERVKTLLHSVSNPVWSQLQEGSLIKIKGWQDMVAGRSALLNATDPYHALEPLDIEVICPASCTSPSAAYAPKLTRGSLVSSPLGYYEINLEGENLIAGLNSINAISLILTNASGIPSELTFNADEVLEISNQGTSVKLKLNRSRISKTLPLPPRAIFVDNYKIAFKNNITGQISSPPIQDTSGSDFGVKSEGSGALFQLEDLSQVTPYHLPTGIEVYLKQGSREVEVQPDEVIGFAVKENIDLSQLEVEVAGQTFNVQQILHDASSGFKYGSFKLPSNLPPGVQDVIIRLSGTPGVTLEQALKVLLPSRVNIRMSRNILFSDGNEKAEVYITVRDAQGQIVPDGSRYFIYGAYPGANPNFYLYDYLTQTSSCIGYYCGPYLQGFEVRNGRMHFKLGVGFYINPLLIVDPWPTINSPSFQLRVCQGSSASCDQDLGPASESAGRFFMHHVDSISVVSTTPEAGGTRIEMEVKDALGNPIPVGHVLTFENGGYSHCLLKQDGTSEFGYSRIPVTEPGKIIVKWNSEDITCNRSTFFNVLQGSVSGYYLKGSPVYLGP